MTRIRWVVAVVSVLVVGLGIVLAVALASDDVASGGSLLVDDPAPTFVVTDFDGARLDLAEYRGKVVLLNFWNEWCAPCQEETPSLVALAEARRDDPNFAMIGIVHDERTEKAAREYATTFKMNYALAFDPAARIALDYGVTGQPETFVVDQNGVVRTFVSGPIDARRMDALITDLQGAG